MTAKILIVDDETDLVRLVAYNLQRAGFETVEAYTGQQALQRLEGFVPDILILDWMLPDGSGIKLTKKLRSNPQTENIPIIMLTARSSEEDRISGFEAGADDYVVKPFSPKELVLRVKAMLARVKPKSQVAQAGLKVLDMGNFKILPDDHCVLTDTGETIALSYTEFQLLLSLAQAANRVKTREQLIQTVWQDAGDDLNDRAVDTQVKRLRKKLGPERDVIETIRGVGYRLVSQNRNHTPEKTLTAV